MFLFYPPARTVKLKLCTNKKPLKHNIKTVFIALIFYPNISCIFSSSVFGISLKLKEV